MRKASHHHDTNGFVQGTKARELRHDEETHQTLLKPSPKGLRELDPDEIEELLTMNYRREPDDLPVEEEEFEDEFQPPR